MALPGLIAPGAALRVLYLDQSQQDFNLWTALGSPAFPITAYVELRGAIVFGAFATDHGWVDTGIDPASRIVLRLVTGTRIQGRGGNGGFGAIEASFDAGPNAWIGQAGGSGGAGSPPGGAGGTLGTHIDLSPGNPGTTEAGGAGLEEGRQELINQFPSPATDPLDGGDAMVISCPYEIYNAGEIWGGGGGGCSSSDLFHATGTVGAGKFSSAGGDPGQPGGVGDAADRLAGTYQASAGHAIRLVGAGAATFRSGGSDPNVKGAVGA